MPQISRSYADSILKRPWGSGRCSTAANRHSAKPAVEPCRGGLIICSFPEPSSWAAS